MSSTLSDVTLYWKLDEASGSRSAAVGGRTLTASGTVGSRAGSRGKAAVFTNTGGQFLSLATNADIALGDTDWTWAFWVQFDSGTAASGLYLLTQADDGGSTKDFYISTAGGPKVNLAVFAGSTSIGVVNSDDAPFVADLRRHLVVAYHSASRDVVGISVDANPATESATSGPASSSGASLRVGSLFSGGIAGFEGAIDNLGLWHRELTTAEIRELYSAGAAPTYPFDVAPAATAQSGVAGTSGTSISTGLAAWNTARGLLPGTPCDVLVIGDSITQGFSATSIETTGYVDWLRDRLQRQYGGAGRGFLPLSTYGQDSSYQNLRWEFSGGNLNPSPDEFGVAGYCKGLGGGSGVTITAHQQYGDRFDIFLLEYTGTGQVTAQIGSETAVTIGTASPTGTPTVNRYTVTSTVGVGTRDLKIIASPTIGHDCYVIGVVARVGTTGVRVHQAAKSGATAGDLFGSANLLKWIDGFSGLNVKLAIIAASVNDYSAQTVLATYKADVERAIQKLQGLASAPSVMLVAGNPRSAGALSIPQTDYNTQLSDLATTYGCAYVSMYSRWASVANADTLLLTVGGGDVHPTDLGHEDYAAELIAHLTAGASAPVLFHSYYQTMGWC